MRRAITVVAGILVVGMLMPAALAGGWAITTFDSVPEEFEAGETYTLTYTILQHGRTPVDVDDPSVTFTPTGKGEPLVFEATHLGETGRYTVEVTVPTAGTWDWEVSQGYFESQDLGTLNVADAGVAAPADIGFDLMQLVRILLPLAAIAAAVYTFRELRVARRRDATPEPG